MTEEDPEMPSPIPPPALPSQIPSSSTLDRAFVDDDELLQETLP